jgi:hypothetical protein
MRRLVRLPVAEYAKRKRQRAAIGRVAELAAWPAWDQSEQASSQAPPIGVGKPAGFDAAIWRMVSLA